MLLTFFYSYWQHEARKRIGFARYYFWINLLLWDAGHAHSCHCIPFSGSFWYWVSSFRVDLMARLCALCYLHGWPCHRYRLTCGATEKVQLGSLIGTFKMATDIAARKVWGASYVSFPASVLVLCSRNKSKSVQHWETLVCSFYLPQFSMIDARLLQWH